jgi:hypothetical protein
MASYIGYHNLFDIATPTQEVAGGGGTQTDVENAVDYYLVDTWSYIGGTAARIIIDTGDDNSTADYIGIAGHNLSGATSLSVQYSTTSGPYSWQGAYTPTISSDRTFFGIFTQQTARYWSVLINGASWYVGHISLGNRLEVQVSIDSYQRTKFADNSRYVRSVNQNGIHLGTSVINEGSSFGIRLIPRDLSWWDSNWPDFHEHFRIKPFFYAYDSTASPIDAIFCGNADSSVPIPTRANATQETVTLNVSGV